MHEPARVAHAVRYPIKSWTSGEAHDLDRDSEATENGRILRCAGRSIMLGACTGSIAAIAATCITSVTELLAIGPEIISVVVRLGLEVLRRSENIEPSNDNWTIAAVNSSTNSMQSTLDAFHQSQVVYYRLAKEISANMGYSIYHCIGSRTSARPHRHL